MREACGRRGEIGGVDVVGDVGEGGERRMRCRSERAYSRCTAGEDGGDGKRSGGGEGVV